MRGRWRGDKVRLKAPGIVKKHTLLCVFTCLVDEVSYSQHDFGKKEKRFFFYALVLGVMEINYSRKRAKDMASADFLTTPKQFACRALR